MNSDYVITNEILSQRYGLNLGDYVNDETMIEPLIYNALDLVIDRICILGDFHSESQIETYLETDDKISSEDKISAFIKAQYRVLYNLLYGSNTDPRDGLVDNIITFQLGCVINGFQKGLHRKVE